MYFFRKQISPTKRDSLNVETLFEQRKRTGVDWVKLKSLDPSQPNTKLRVDLAISKALLETKYFCATYNIIGAALDNYSGQRNNAVAKVNASLDEALNDFRAGKCFHDLSVTLVLKIAEVKSEEQKANGSGWGVFSSQKADFVVCLEQAEQQETEACKTIYNSDEKTYCPPSVV
jgi:hypothetical protein